MEDRTLVLLGKTGNGKSATGNSILGRKEFESKQSGGSVTAECKAGQCKWKNGRTINVVDTPGVFDTNASQEIILREIVKCIDLAKDGVHAFILVLSIGGRFTKEETDVLDIMQMLFGPKVIDYMVVLFTRGDDLEDEDEFALKTYLKTCPKTLTSVLRRCDNRVVVFDNKTRSKEKKEEQVDKLLKIVDRIVSQNAKRAYINELFQEAKKMAEEMPNIVDMKKQKDEETKQKEKYYEEQMKGKDQAYEDERKLKTYEEVIRQNYEEEKKRKDAAYEEERKQKDLFLKDQMELLKAMMKKNLADMEQWKKSQKSSGWCTIS